VSRHYDGIPADKRAQGAAAGHLRDGVVHASRQRMQARQCGRPNDIDLSIACV